MTKAKKKKPSVWDMALHCAGFLLHQNLACVSRWRTGCASVCPFQLQSSVPCPILQEHDCDFSPWNLWWSGGLLKVDGPAAPKSVKAKLPAGFAGVSSRQTPRKASVRAVYISSFRWTYLYTFLPLLGFDLCLLEKWVVFALLLLIP